MRFLIILGLLWLVGAIFSNTARKVRPARPSAEGRVDHESEDARFQREFELWMEHLSRVIDAGRWIPKGAVRRFLVEHPAPMHPRRKWRQVAGESSPEETLRIRFDRANASHLARQKVVRKEFFNTVEKNPLTDEQIHACICMDDSVMVVAAAGSGKTSTMVAKTGYALLEKLATPEQILLLAFNKATAEEVGQRIAERLRGVPDVQKVRSNTFHAFGIEVIGKVTGKRPALAPWVSPDNPGADIREVFDIIESLSRQDAAFKREWDQFRIIYARDVGKWGQRQQPDAYSDGKRGFLTAGGEIVKGKEERVIADWLFYNRVTYKYERPYEHDTADAQHRQYSPDFYYPDADLYHEHFALNRQGEAPRHFKDYLAGVKWKRRIHVAKGTSLFETTSDGLFSGQAIQALKEALTARGVTPVFDPTRESVGLRPVEEQDLARSFRTFQQHVKNNGLTHRQLHTALVEQSSSGYGARLRMYLTLYERIAGEWERRLKEGNYIDFEDMLVQAAEHVESGAYKSPFLLILADEFQDSSRARIRLLKALAGNPGVPTNLCVVGDDWQGINRFAGSDISVMTEFEQTFEHATRLRLNTTFRCPQSLCDVSSQFIQANPAQIKKTVKTTNQLDKTPLLAYGFAREAAASSHIEEQLAAMHGYAAAGRLLPAKGSHITVLLLGRYRRDIPASLAQWQRRFGDRLKIEFKTAHGSKGLEAEYVFVLNVTQGTHGFPSQIQDDPALQLAMPAPDPYPYAEERRLFYVAMTRAIKQVRFYTNPAQPSQFLMELVKRKHLIIEPMDGEGVEPCARPGCGGVMVPRGNGSFLGCSHFPACDQTRKLKNQAAMQRAQRITVPVAAGQTCPVCEKGVMRERRGSNGPFYGCSRFRHGCTATANIKCVGVQQSPVEN